MKYHKQKVRHRPELGEFGDCHRTALACLLDLDPEDIPNFGMHYGDADAFSAAERDWLASVGLSKFSIAMPGHYSIDEVLLVTMGSNAKAICIFAGTSRTGVNHSVVAHNGKIIHDPSLDDAGIIGPCDCGNYYFDVLIPISTTMECNDERMAA